MPRLAGDGIHQSLTRVARRSGASGGHRQQRHIPAQQLEFATAVGAAVQMGFERNQFVALQRAQRVQREIFRELFVYAHATTALRSASNPARILVLMVPSGSPVLAAISVWVKPSK